MKKTVHIIAALLACALVSVGAQARQPVIRVSPFIDAGVGSSEASMIERMVASYVVELRAFRVIDSQGQEMALNETEVALSLGSTAPSAMPLTADYIITGTLGRIGEIYVFTLDTTKVASGEKLTVSDTAVSISDIVLRARDLTKSLFGRQDSFTALPGQTSVARSSAAIESGPARDLDKRQSPSTADLVGSWKGDKGLETVRLFPNATGLAILSGGGTLKVSVSIAGDTIEIVQDQPNDAIMYRASSVTFEMARRIAAEARPMRWLFTLSSDGQRLTGSKESIAINGSGVSMKVDNNYVRDASWTRISR
jgi:hypothetical protein